MEIVQLTENEIQELTIKADAGDVEALTKLGLHYYKYGKRGTTQKMFELLSRAANKGSVEAQYRWILL